MVLEQTASLQRMKNSAAVWSTTMETLLRLGMNSNIIQLLAKSDQLLVLALCCSVMTYSLPNREDENMICSIHYNYHFHYIVLF